MTTQLLVRLDSELKSRMQKLAQTEGKTASQVVRELIEDYVTDRDMAGAVDFLWNRVGNSLESRGVELKDIPGAIEDVRARRR
jgi:predicted DNA-binding protein